ncbi:hypothetical protein LSH36_1050g00033 [Paralvinella palmiformis]|uniref:Tyrosine decarboxylase n=1 Tax=Paralvinella palmiformis TaxID=53620 RepID=A0AAD9IW37_9ANNE|nr:hypothetical protein LSH36_1050g00033 [Paralvinella palmiformis]
MNTSEFRKRGKEMVDYLADYMEDIDRRRVFTEVQPEYLREMLQKTAPGKGEQWENIIRDVNNTIMPGITHRHGDVANFPTGNSYPSILGDMLSNAIRCVGFSWAASPACTELETVVMDWLANMIGLPPVFLHETGIGGGVIQSSASECVLVSLLAARFAAIKDLKRTFPFLEDGVLLSRMVAYRSKLAHSWVEKAAMIAMVNMRELDTDDNFSLRGATLQKAIDEDRKLGLIPFFMCATLGTTAVCSFDNLDELGLICERENLWLHVDAAYAGSAFICPEFQPYLKGIEHVNSFNMNLTKWMLVNYDLSIMWIRDRKLLTTALGVDPLYLQHQNSDQAVDFRADMFITAPNTTSSSTVVAATLTAVAVVVAAAEKNYVFPPTFQHTRLGKKFGDLVRNDSRFEVIGEETLGLVCFRLVGHNYHTQMLLRAINMSGKLHMVPALINDQYVIRFAICAQNACEDDILFAWNVIGEMAVDVLEACRSSNENDVLKAIEKLESLDLTEEDDEGITDTPSVPPPVIPEKPETEHIPEQNEDIDQMAVEVLEACRSSNENDVTKSSEKLQSLDPTKEDDEEVKDTPPVVGIAEKPEAELNDIIGEDELFLYDDNIPSIPSISTL